MFPNGNSINKSIHQEHIMFSGVFVLFGYIAVVSQCKSITIGQ